MACYKDLKSGAGIVQSVHFPKPYPGDLNCVWHIAVPVDRTIQVSFNKTFSMAGKETAAAASCRGDYLQLFNGYSTKAPPLLLNGSSDSLGRYCGTSAPSGTLETSSHTLTAKFVSDHSKSGAGFSFSYTELHLGCNGQLSLTNGITSGIFTSPRHPKPYPKNVDCKWVIKAPAKHRVQIDFLDDFHTGSQDTSGCTGGYLEFHDGGTVNAPRIGRQLCGTNLPGSLIASGNLMLARLRTDEHKSHTGFKAKYSVATCGGRMFGREGFLTSPNFPRSYGPNLDCFWVVQGPVGHFLTINITQMNLQSSAGCKADVLEIIDPALSKTAANSTIEKQETSIAYQGISVIEAKANSSGSILYKGCENFSRGSGVMKSFDTADNRAYIWFKSDKSIAAPGFKIKYEASIEVCGGDLSTSSGSFQSPNIAHGRVCTWRITVPIGRKIKLTFKSFHMDVAQGGVCRNDYVKVINGLLEESPLLKLVCGKNTPAAITSTGNTMKVIFKTNKAGYYGSFKASYSSNQDAVCGEFLTKTAGQITSPGFAVNKGRNYGHNIQCIWKIENTGQNSSIKLEFTHFSLQYDRGCHLDFVEIREGTDENSPAVGRFCGNSKNNKNQWNWLLHDKPVVVIPTANIWMAFITDKTEADKGFQVNYTFTDCGGVSTGSAGVITSPNYPDNYGNNENCAWLIRAPEGKIIHLNFTDFEFENQSTCNSDFLIIQNGGSYDAPQIGKFCESKAVSEIKSQSNELRLVMATDSNGTAKGFRLEYSFNKKGCSGDYHRNQGSIASPNHPHSYPHNAQCQWKITAEPGYRVVLKFHPPFDVACNDSVKVYDGPYDGPTKSLGSYCDDGTSKSPSVLKSSLNELSVVFQSGADTNGNGFSAKYSSVCGGVFESPSAVLLSPGYPGYENNMRCEYVIKPGPRYITTISFDDFQLQGGRHDSLKIYRGSNTRGPKLKDFDGESASGQQVVAVAPIFLVFKTDGSHTFRGFKAHYSAYECGGNLTASKGEIGSPLYPNPYPDHLSCTWIINAGENKTIFLQFPIFNIYWSWRCHLDELSLYDGDNTKAKYFLRKTCGNRDNVPFMSTGNSLLLHFKTGYSTSNHRKSLRRMFYAVFKSSYGPKVGCGGTLTQKNGSFQSLDLDGDGAYEPNLYCRWKITVDSGKVVVINITQLDLFGNSSECYGDSLEVIEDKNVIQTFCGKKDSAQIVKSTRNSVLVIFMTDDEMSASGFKANFYQEDRVCGKILVAKKEAQTLTSPTSSGLESRCSWVLDSKGKYDQVRIEVKNLTMGKDCQAEYLEVLDEPMGKHGMKIKACHTKKPPRFYSRGQKAKIIYHGSSDKGGFTLSYQKAGCDRTYTSPAGRVTSPNLPNSYRSTTCTTKITLPKSAYLSLYFNSFSVYRTYRCWSDYVQITGDNNSGKLCGKTVPSPMFMTKSATIKFARRRRRWGQGSTFDITYIVSSQGKGCGGNITHAIPGRISNPPYPKGPLECTWELNSPRTVEMKLTTINTVGAKGNAGDNYCAKSYLELIRSDGLSLGKYCSKSSLYSSKMMRKGKVKYYVAEKAAGVQFTLKFYYLDQASTIFNSRS